MDFESIKLLGLNKVDVDRESTYQIFDPSNNNHIIFVHLNKQTDIICPLCGTVNNFINKGTKSQDIKYSAATIDNIILRLYRRVYSCKSCGHYFKEPNPFTESNKTISVNKDLQILENLKDINSTYKSTAKKFKVSVTYVTNLFDKKIDLKRLELPAVLCVDEVYAKRLSFHKYCFIAYDPRHREIIDVINSRRLEKLEDYFVRIDYNERKNVKFFSMDLYESYRILAKKCFPNAIICADPFHVIENLSNCLKALRIKIMKKYAYLKDQNDNYYWLFKKHAKLLTKDQSRLSDYKFETRAGQYMSQKEIVEYMLSIDNDLRKSYDIYQEYLTFNSTATLKSARDWLTEIISKYKLSYQKENIPAWKLLENWKEEIVNSFNIYEGRRITNGPMERANRDIKSIFNISFGMSNFPRTRNRIMYVMNSGSPILYTSRKYTNKRKFKKRGKYNKHK